MALISVAGAPPRLFRVGHVVHDDVIIRRVLPHGVLLASRNSREPWWLSVAAAAPGATPLSASDRAGLMQAVASDGEASPIIPPHADMRAPSAANAGTPDSAWSRQRRTLPDAQPAPDARSGAASDAADLS
jgi:hypothetical protein